jgi:short-subunit dehydrogenase
VLGFSDSLRVELMGSGVAVTVICPDFVVSEIHDRAYGGDGRAHGKTPYDNRTFMTAEECARQSVEAIEKRKRLAVLSFRGWLGRFVRPFAPGLIDAIAARAVRRIH